MSGELVDDEPVTEVETIAGAPRLPQRAWIRSEAIFPVVGVAIVAALWAGYWGAHLVGLLTDGSGPTASGVLVLSLATTLAIVGFLDDFIKISRQRSLGLRSKQKLAGQAFVGISFAVLALQFVACAIVAVSICTDSLDEDVKAHYLDQVEEVLAVIRDLAAEGWSMVIVTHEVKFASQVADQVLFIDGGLVVEQGPPAEVISNPQNPRTQDFLRRILEPI